MHRRRRGPAGALLAWTLLIPVAAMGASAPPEVLDPEAAIRIAIENNPLLQASSAGVDRANAERAVADSGYLPRVELTEDFVRSTNPVFVFASKLGQERFTAADFDLQALNVPDPLTNSALRVNVRQNIWDAGRTITGKKAAGLGIEVAEQNRNRTVQQVAFGAQAAFWNVVVAKEMLLVARDAEKAAQANVDLAGELVDAGLAVSSDRLSAEVRLSEVQAMRIRAEQGIEVAHAALRQALGVGEDRGLAVRPPDETPGGWIDSLDARIEEALRSRPDLLAVERRVEQARLGEKIARSRRRPEIGAMAGYEWNGENFLGTDGDNWTIGLGLKLSVFDGTETRARVGVATARTSEASAMAEAMRQGIRLEVRSAWADREAAEQRLAVAATALERASESLRIVRDRYGEGMAVMVELLAAEAAHTRARANHVAARGDVWLAHAALDLATGRTTWKNADADGNAPGETAARTDRRGTDDEIR